MKDANAIWDEVEAVIGKLQATECAEAAESLRESLRSSAIRSELLGRCAKTVEILLQSEIGSQAGVHEDLVRLRASLKSELRKFLW